MPSKTDAQKKAQKKYMDKFTLINVRVTPEKKQIIQNHAKQTGEPVNAFINRAITETIERDNEQ